MKTLKQKKDYFLDTSKEYFSNYRKSRFNFLNRKKKFFHEISYFLNKCTHNSKRSLYFCCGNSIIADQIKSKEKFIHEIDYYYLKQKKSKKVTLNNKLIHSCDHIIISDTEHQKNLISNLNTIQKNMNDNARIMVISKSLIWMGIINFLRKTFSFKKSFKTNFLPFNDLKSIFINQKFEFIKNEKIIIFPFAIPLLTSLFNTLCRLPILNFFCMMNITIFKKKNIIKNKAKISFIIPCKNEEDNISLIGKKMMIPKID